MESFSTMGVTRPLSNDVILLIFTSIGVLTLIPNLICLYLIIKMRSIYARNIFVVVSVLQVFYLLESFHVSVIFIPFIHITLGGGYCIGWACEPHHVHFTTNLSICMILMVNLCALFVLLLLHRHQNLINGNSKLKMGRKTICVFSALLLLLSNALPIRYSSISITNSTKQAAILKQRCTECDWEEKGRNYGVLSEYDAEIDGIIVTITLSFYTLFGFACAMHMWRVIREYRMTSLSSGARTTVRISQTRQSLVQVVIFILFFATPITLFMTISFIHFEDDSVVLLPSMFLFSINALVHSLHTIATTPPILTYLRQAIYKGTHGVTPTSTLSYRI